MTAVLTPRGQGRDITGLTIKRIAKEVGFVGEPSTSTSIQDGSFPSVLDASFRSIESTRSGNLQARISPLRRPPSVLGLNSSFPSLNNTRASTGSHFSDALYIEDPRPLFKKFKDCMLDLKGRLRKNIETGAGLGRFPGRRRSENQAIRFLGIIHDFTLWTVFEERRSYMKRPAPISKLSLWSTGGHRFRPRRCPVAKKWTAFVSATRFLSWAFAGCSPPPPWPRVPRLRFPNSSPTGSPRTTRARPLYHGSRRRPATSSHRSSSESRSLHGRHARRLPGAHYDTPEGPRGDFQRHLPFQHRRYPRN